MCSGNLPSEWKIHKIIPVYKSWDKSSVANYWPISVLCVISKVLERLVYNKVIDTIATSITPHQFGFQRNASTHQQLLIYFHELITSREQIDTIYIDFQKAFDSVPHNKSMVKLWNIGITGTLWNWFNCYLSNRTQYVSIGNCLSNYLPVISGVPQGSILGPLLFLIFINDLPSTIISQIFEFADDTKCFRLITSKSDIQQLQHDLNSLFNWTLNNHLSFNLSKFVFMSFHHKFSSLYNVNGHVISESSSCKDLGVIFTKSLSWREHYQMITAKPITHLDCYVGFSHCPQAQKFLYISLVRSKLLYCSTLWRPHLLKDIELVEKVQRRATKFMLSDYSSDYRSRLIQLGMLPLMYIYEIADHLWNSRHPFLHQITQESNRQI